jgi:ornithine cyclodeaminase/alanine dehydrogenase
LICPVDFDSYVAPSVLLETDRFYTDDLDQLAYYRTQGYFSALPDERVELADVVVGKDAGRRTNEEQIVVMNLGIALEDVAVGKVVYERAKARGLGTELEA